MKEKIEILNNERINYRYQSSIYNFLSLPLIGIFYCLAFSFNLNIRAKIKEDIGLFLTSSKTLV